MKLIAISKINTASRNIGEILLKKYKFKSADKVHPELPLHIRDDIILVECAENVLDLGYLENYFQPELMVIASSHKSEAGVPTLTCHAPGNWATADFGGQPRALAIAPALHIREALLKLYKLQAHNQKLAKYQVSLEVTHHGPTPSIPVLFVEVGSTEEEWSDLAACEAVADAIWATTSKRLRKPKSIPVVIGFGGTHYAPGFTRKVLQGKLISGHICPKYQIDELDETMILQAFKRTIPKPDYAALEWKGLTKSQRDKIIKILEKNKLNWKKI